MSENEKFLKGRLLLDGGSLRGSFFHHTVVLICVHNAEGAFGLVLNRVAGNKIGEVIVADLPDTLKGWKPSTFTEASHKTTAYPIAGKHQGLACAKCHPAAVSGVNYRPKFQACLD